MCFRTRITAPDTSAQQAETQRQLDALLAQAEARRQEDLRLAEERRSGDQARYDEQIARQQAEYDRQYAATMAQHAQERAAQEAAAADDAARWNAMLTQLKADADAGSAADRAYAEQQIELIRSEAAARQAQQDQQYSALLAKQEAERAEVQAATEARATRAKEYATGRQNLVDTFTAEVNGAYAGFDDDFYSKYAQDYVNAANPALDRQYEKERNDLVYAFADAGSLDSRAANKEFAELDRVKETRRARVAQEAYSNTQDFQDQIDQQRRDTLTSAFMSGSLGREDLPDGVTDVAGSLDSIRGGLDSILGDVRNRAASATPRSQADIDAIVGGVSANSNTPRSTLQTFGRWGGTSGVNTNGAGRTSYTVRS